MNEMGLLCKLINEDTKKPQEESFKCYNCGFPVHALEDCAIGDKGILCMACYSIVKVARTHA